MAKRLPVRSLLVQEFTNNPGAVLHVESLVRQTGLQERQVQTGMANLLSSHVLPGLRRVVAGHSWLYEPQRAPDAPQDADRTQTPASAPRRRTDKLRSFQEVGETRDGDIIVQGEQGELYRAQPL